MAGEGSIMAMITSLKNNKIPKRDHKLGHLEYVKGVPIGKPLRYKNKLSERQMSELRQKLRKEKSKRIIITICIYVICLSTVASLIFYYLY